MAELVSKVRLFQFGGQRLARSSILLNLRQSSEGVQTTFYRHAKMFSSVFKYTERPSHVETKQRFYSHSFHTVFGCLYSSEGEGMETHFWTTDNLVGAWFHEAIPFGAVSVHDVPFDVHIQPLNPMDYPELNKSIVKFFYNNTSGTPIAGRKLSDMGKLTNAKVCMDGGRLNVSCDVPQGVQLPLVCVIIVPLKFDVDVQGAGGGNFKVKGMESDSVRVHLKHGDCHLSSLKTGTVTVDCEEGNIVSNQQLLGTISLRCGNNGSIRAGRLQGQSVDCRTDEGDIDIKTLYADHSSCHSRHGNIHIRDCHGNMVTSTKQGNLTVDSLDGKLSAELGSGSADAYITRHDDVLVRSQTGDITLRFSEDGACSLDLDAAVIESDNCLAVDLDDQGKGFLKSETKGTVRASAAQGKISLKKQDWLSAIKLQSGNTTL